MSFPEDSIEDLYNDATANIEEVEKNCKIIEDYLEELNFNTINHEDMKDICDNTTDMICSTEQIIKFFKED